jgi:endonuclease V-like protein UPF0215 family
MFSLKIRLEKKGIRALGIAESFKKEVSPKSILGGVVMRSDLIIDGFIFGEATLEGDDATESILEMFRSLNRNDLNVIIIAGAIISLYNIIDVDQLGSETETPIICVTFEESKGIESSIRKHFPNNWMKKIELYRKLGDRESIDLQTGYKVYIRTYGLDKIEVKRTLDKFTLQGSIPEPLRIAHLIAKARIDARR